MRKAFRAYQSLCSQLYPLAVSGALPAFRRQVRCL